MNYTITMQVDRTCEMAKVSLNGKLIMEGNFWDFHPGCHGIRKYGYFDSYVSLSTRIYQWLIKVKKADFRNINTVRGNYSYH